MKTKMNIEEYQLSVTFKFKEGEDVVEEMARAMNGLAYDLLREGITRVQTPAGLPVLAGPKRVGSLKRV